MMERTLRVTYDAKADAANIKLVESREGDRVRTHRVDGGPILLDFDSTGLVGIECLNASKVLPPRLLDQAIDITDSLDGVSLSELDEEFQEQPW